MQNPWPSNDSAPWPGGEWVEIKNNGTQPINLSGWSLRDAVETPCNLTKLTHW